MAKKTGRQTPTHSVTLPFKKSKGAEAVRLYEQSGRKAIKWQKDLIRQIMAVGQDGLWVHQRFGYEVPRRNGKNEILAIRELWSLEHGEKVCHTAHRVTTAHQAWQRLCRILADAGYEELGRKKKNEDPPEKSFRTTKALGLETVTLTNGGTAVFRTRTANGGLGEGFDLLVIDEAQEYTTAQQSALVYTVSDSPNPQTLFCGTPPTTESAGTVFPEMRKSCLDGTAYDTGWAEWSVDSEPKDLMDQKLWWQCNPSMGYHLNVRKIRAEYDPNNPLDFIIQRLGYWYLYSLKSAISEADWRRLEVQKRPDLQPERYFGIKFGKDGMNACLAVASKTTDGQVFVEAIDCRPIRSGIEWIIPFLQNPSTKKVIVDGAAGSQMLVDLMKENKLKAPIQPTVAEIIDANAKFEIAVFNDGIRHIDQEALRNAISNCKHRNIGNKGGFGYETLDQAYEVGLIESVSLAYWICSESKAKRRQNYSF